MFKLSGDMHGPHRRVGILSLTIFNVYHIRIFYIIFIEANSNCNTLNVIKYIAHDNDYNYSKIPSKEKERHFGMFMTHIYIYILF